jgi:hypothetical protein
MLSIRLHSKLVLDNLIFIETQHHTEKKMFVLDKQTFRYEIRTRNVCLRSQNHYILNTTDTVDKTIKKSMKTQ